MKGDGAETTNMQIGQASSVSPDRTIHHFAFLLLNGFSPLSYSTAIETLRIANRVAGQIIFNWVTLSESGDPVISNQDLAQVVDSGLTSVDRRTTVLVCGGERIESASTSRILAWIREHAAHGGHVGGLCTAAWTLAEAGLLTSSQTTIHWENEESFSETYPHVVLTRTPFVIDGNRSATAGGTAAIDLMLEFISQIENHELATATSDRLLYGSIRKLQGNSKITHCYRIGLSNPKLRQAIGFMERNLVEEIGPNDVAGELQISVRQLERLFRQHLMQSPKKYLTEMRLERSERLLLQTDMSIIEVAMAAGFSSASQFSKVFRRRFGQSPYKLRTAF